jgi:2-keto-4-pentenoate hydratase/2-oxohepta-3-ene-1,7-dioic acid hydratase in catechol pathway
MVSPAFPVRRFARIETASGPRWAEKLLGGFQPLDAAPWENPKADGAVIADAPLLPCSPASKVVCVGQNYRKHAQEMGKPVPEEPLLFIKPSTGLNAHGAPIRLPPASQEVHHEAELALIIGKTLSKVDEAGARAGIFGLSCFNDVTARDIQKREVQHTRAKSYDTFACLGPWLVTGVDDADLFVQARVNGEKKQDGRTSDMIFPPARLVSFISQIMTLLPGDVISTGTPSGVGPIKDGDVVEIEIEHVGVLRNPVQR